MHRGEPERFPTSSVERLRRSERAARNLSSVRARNVRFVRYVTPYWRIISGNSDIGDSTPKYYS